MWFLTSAIIFLQVVANLSFLVTAYANPGILPRLVSPIESHLEPEGADNGKRSGHQMQRSVFFGCWGGRLIHCALEILQHMLLIQARTGFPLQFLRQLRAQV